MCQTIHVAFMTNNILVKCVNGIAATCPWPTCRRGPEETIAFDVVPNAGELAKAGKVTVLGIESAKRSALFPDVPTTVEADYPNSEYNFWMGSFMPAKTPSAIVDRVNAEVFKALQKEDIKSKIGLLGGEVETMTVDQFNSFISKERIANAEIVKLINFQPQ